MLILSENGKEVMHFATIVTEDLLTDLRKRYTVEVLTMAEYVEYYSNRGLNGKEKKI